MTHRLSRVLTGPRKYFVWKMNKLSYAVSKKYSDASSRKEAYSEDKETHFGYETVTEEEKARKVYSVFENVASKYDIMNDFMSGGVHRVWKDHFVDRLSPTPGTSLLDVAGGTGDIAFRFLKYVRHISDQQPSASLDIHNPLASETTDTSSSSSSSESDEDDSSGSRVVVSDINQAMLDVGKQRAKQFGYCDKEISWLQADAENLPIKDNSFDAYTIAFGIRNVVHIDKVLSEAYRVLKPGGRFMCLEFSEVTNPLVQRLYDVYSFEVIPVIGQIVARDWKSYQYLVESIRNFPNQEDFKSMIEDAGFNFVTYENLTFGVAAIHSGFKL